MDIELKGKGDKTGIKIAEMIKGKIAVPVIICSIKYEHEEYVTKNNLCYKFLHKPCDIEELINYINGALS